MGKTILPPAGQLAEEVRVSTVDAVAARYGVTVKGAQRRLNNGGYAASGEPHQGRRPSYPSFDAAPVVPVDDRWMAEAACVGMEPSWFFPENRGPRGTRAAEELAKSICAGCPVRLRCLEWALVGDEATAGGSWGIHGGLNGGERDQLRKQRRSRVAS